ncbi:MAG: DUF4129 domain-containing protein [Mucilaginibacter sp.]
MLRKLTFALLLLLFVTVTDRAAAIAKNKSSKTHHAHKAPLPLYYDTSNVQTKHFDANAINHFKKDPQFNYTDYSGAGETSFLERLWQWIIEHLFGWMKHAKLGGGFSSSFLWVLKYLFYAVLIAFVVFVVIKSFGLDLIRLFRRRSKKIPEPYSELIEDINRIDFDDELEKAITQGNYRFAVRLLYLHCLKQLSDLQLIDWQIDKTNSAYVNELSDPSQKQTFRVITRQFEYVWYGNFSIDKHAFISISNIFQDFKQKLS